MADENSAELSTKEMQEEYERLLGKLRGVTQEKQRLTTEMRQTCRQQESELRLLEAENKELQSSIFATRSRSAKRDKRSDTTELQKLIAQKEKLEKLAEAEKRQILQLEAQIRRSERCLDWTRGVKGGVVSAAAVKSSKQEAILQLERKLQSFNQKYSGVVWENFRLRGEIENLRADRGKFMQIFSKLEVELTNLHELKGRLIAETTKVLKAGEESRRRTRELKERANADQREHAEQKPLLQRQIQNVSSLEEFLRIKLQERQADPEVLRLLERLKARQELRLAEEAEQETDLTAAFDVMMRHYEVANYADMVRKFMTVEDVNFGLFRYCTSAQATMAVLSDQAQQLLRDIRDIREEKAADSLRVTQLMTEVASSVGEVKATRLRLSEQLSARSDILDALADGAARMSDACGADVASLDSQLVREPRADLLTLMGIVETRVGELLLLRSRLNVDKTEKSPTPNRLSQFEEIRLPEVEEVESESEQPLSRGDIEYRLLYQAL